MLPATEQPGWEDGMSQAESRNGEKEAIKLLFKNSVKGQRGGAEPQDAELSLSCCVSPHLQPKSGSVASD